MFKYSFHATHFLIAPCRRADEWPSYDHETLSGGSAIPLSGLRLANGPSART
jgi:hypothetical protein